MNLSELIENVDNIPPAVQTLPKLQSLLMSEDSSFDEIVELIKIDPSLTAHVLKLSNSAFYGQASHIDDIEEAVGRIGIQEVYKLVAMVCGMELLKDAQPVCYLDEGQLWEQSLACGIVMEKMARDIGQDPSSSYTIGLLHSLGKIVINRYLSDTYEKVFFLLEEEGLSLTDAEKEILGFDHAEIGASLLKSWDFSPDTYLPIQYQYLPSSVPDFKDLTCMLHLSIWVVANIGLNHGKDAWAFTADPNAAQRIEVSSDMLTEYLMSAHEKLKEMQHGMLVAG